MELYRAAWPDIYRFQQFSNSELIKAIQGKQSILIWGRAIYMDVFSNTEKHVTCFAVAVAPNTLQWADGGKKPLNLQTAIDNPGAIKFTGVSLPFLRTYNCSDDDCKEPCAKGV